MSLTFFIAGIIQGSLADGMHEQDYRAQIASAVRRRFPDARIVDPVALHPNSLNYSDEQARDTFFAMIEEAKAADVVIAFLPSCSMGTAVEMWEAHRAGKPVISVSPLAKNWAVRYLSTRVVGSMEELDEALAGLEK